MTTAVKKWVQATNVVGSNEVIFNKSFERIELLVNDEHVLLTIDYAEKVDIQTIGDIKAYTSEITKVPKEWIVLCHIPTGITCNDKHRLPQERVQRFAVNILRVDVHTRSGRRVGGYEIIFVAVDNTVFSEFKRHGYVLKRKFVTFDRYIVSAERDTFRNIGAVNASVFNIKEINKQIL